jgi:hypothetical protein
MTIQRKRSKPRKIGRGSATTADARKSSSARRGKVKPVKYTGPEWIGRSHTQRLVGI